MPEGPSIVILREETAKFVGQVVREVGGNSRQDIQRMAGQRVRALCSWGKHFLIVFDGFFLRVHFMLFGRYRVDALKENANPRLSLRFDNGELNLYACSVKFVEGDPDDTYDWRGDVMADAWDPALARKKLKAMPNMLAADALLEQDVFAGVGNIIKNEVLWRIRVHPESAIGALPARQLGDLIREARAYSFDFLAWKKAFVLRKHYQVHTKSTCPRDGHKLTWRKHLGEKRRRAFFCEVCQVLYGGAETSLTAARIDRSAAASAARRSGAQPVASKALREQATAKKANTKKAAETTSPPKNGAIEEVARTGPSAKKAAAKKVPSKHAAKKVPAEKIAAKRVPAKKIVARKVAAKKGPARKIAAKKVAAKNVAAKKAATATRSLAAKKAAATKARANARAPTRSTLRRAPTGGRASVLAAAPARTPARRQSPTIRRPK